MNTCFFVRPILIFLACLTLSACTLAPKTSGEFRRLCKERNGLKTITADVPLETVIVRINEHAKKCSTYGTTTTRREGMGGNPAASRYSDRQFTRWEHLKSDRPTFFVVKDSEQDLNRQPGGFFHHVIDLERKGDKTVARLYDPNHPFTYAFNEEYAAAILGQKGPCQYQMLTAE